MLYITETRKVKIELCFWRGGWNAGYEPDCFADMDTDWHKYWDSELEACKITDVELDEIIKWWEAEVDGANDDPGYEGDALTGVSYTDSDDGCEWRLFVEDIK